MSAGSAMWEAAANEVLYDAFNQSANPEVFGIFKIFFSTIFFFTIFI